MNPKADALNSESARPWAPRAEIAPNSREVEAGVYEIRGNGGEGCYGGWDLALPIPDSPWIRVRVWARAQGLQRGLDSVRAALVWGDAAVYAGMNWEPVLAVEEEAGSYLFEGACPVPPGAERLTLRLLLCWSATGSLIWRDVQVEPIPAPPPRKWCLAAGGGAPSGGPRTVQTNTEAYLGFCREAAENNADLLCLPEVMLTTGMPSGAGTLADQAIAIPGPETEPFQAFCREAGMVLCFSAWERRQERVTNTAMLIDRNGDIAGTYRKVHLASPLEPWWGVTPGHGFPVHDVHGARIAMNICMDSSVAESARTPAMAGAEILCMPIMGDHHAVTGWQGGPSDFDIDRWRAIQRVRAMDNQVFMVVSVNAGLGTCIVGPDGEVIDMIQGRRRIVYADADLNRWPRSWLHATFRGTNHWVRRQPAYGPLADSALLAGGMFRWETRP